MTPHKPLDRRAEIRKAILRHCCKWKPLSIRALAARLDTTVAAMRKCAPDLLPKVKGRK